MPRLLVCLRAGKTRVMTILNSSVSAHAGSAMGDVDRLRLAVAAYLARFKGASRQHAESGLRVFLAWCAGHRLAPLAAGRVHVELYVRWLQEVRRFKPSTVSRRVSVVAGFYRTCVVDGILEHLPAEYVRRPAVPAESPTLTHLQLEALLTSARESDNPFDDALIAMLGLLGLRIFEATGLDVGDLGEEHGHRVLRVVGKGGKTVLVPLPPAVGRALDRAIGDRTMGPLLLNRREVRMDRHCATRRLHHLAAAAGPRMPNLHPHMLRHTYVTTSWMLGWTCATCRSPPGTPIRAPPCATTGPATTSTDTPTTSSPPTWPPPRDNPNRSTGDARPGLRGGAVGDLRYRGGPLDRLDTLDHTGL